MGVEGKTVPRAEGGQPRDPLLTVCPPVTVKPQARDKLKTVGVPR